VSDRQSAIVIGGGIIGCSAAYYLAKDGWQVTLLEQNRIGSGCSHGNCGFICPSHVLPLTMAGAAWNTIKTMFRKDSALHVKLRWDPAFWAWLLRFALQCRQRNFLKTAAARHALLASSMKLYRQLGQDESLDAEWQDRGLLLVYKSAQDFAAGEMVANLVRNEFGILAVRYEGEELQKIEPALRPSMAGGWHYPGDSHVRPDRLMASLAILLKSRGVDLREKVSVTEIKADGAHSCTVQTSDGHLWAGLLVLAAGAETPFLARQLGCRIPIQPGKGYSITMPRPERAPSIPIIFHDYHVAVTPWANDIRIGSTMEFTGYDRTINQRRIDLFRRTAMENLVDFSCQQIQETWYGWRPMTYDELPCIGRIPAARNVIVAAGHGMIGMASGPATGKLIAEIASGSNPHIDPAPYALSRFG
jgi:D-amino-acid dehydrogenase